MNTDGRYEIKFILNEYDSIKAKRWLNLHTTARREHPCRQVHSIYFDNNEYQSVKDNLAGISDRLKIRLRWYYSKDSSYSEPVIEIKKRDGRLGFKKRILLPEIDKNIMDYSLSEITSILNKQLLNDALACSLFNQYLTPTLYVNYDRSYFSNHNNIRITKDEKINFSYIVPSKKPAELPGMPYTLKVLELKFSPEYKDEVSRWLKHLHLVPKRHSKYLTGLAVFGQVQYL